MKFQTFGASKLVVNKLFITIMIKHDTFAFD